MTPLKVCAMAVLLVLGVQQAFPFTVRRLEFLPNSELLLFDANHEDITADGLIAADIKLTTVIQRTGRGVGFNYGAIKEVMEANRLTDSVDSDIPAVHFDAESALIASSMLALERTEIVTHAKNGQYVQARRALGHALHTLQDFYAHTNWININFVQTHNPDLGVKSFSNVAARATCDKDGLLNGTELTSGYFAKDQLRGAFTAYTNPYPFFIYHWPDDRCIHGSSLTSSAAASGKGINKDSTLRDGFDSAKAAATKSTTEFVKLVIADLAGFDDAICGLLGQQNSPSCAGAPKSATLTVPINFGGWTGLPATISLGDFTSRSIPFFQGAGNSATCGTGERGSPLFSNSLPANAVLYAAATVSGVPFQTVGPGVNRRNCSSFLAIAAVPHPTDARQPDRIRVWINGTGRGQQFGGAATFDWESQVRFDSGDPFTGKDKSCSGGTVPNAGFFGKAWTTASCSFEIKY